jgi:CP family cyanate transporter-like MFS transporter
LSIRQGASIARWPLIAALIWLTSFNLRSVIMGVPPVLPPIGQDLNLSFAATGAIPSLSLLCVGLASLPGATLTKRLGARRLMSAALAILAIGAFIRLVPPQTFWIYLGTALLSCAIGAGQPALAQLLRTWFPNTVGAAASLYANGLLAGGVIAAAATPLIAAAAGWRATFVVWGALAAVGAVLWVGIAPPREQTGVARGELWRLARQPEVWLSAGLFACTNLAFFTTVAWLPFLLRDTSPSYVALVLFLYNASSLPPSLVLAAVRWNFVTSSPFYVVASLMGLLGTAGLLLGHNEWAWALCTLAGAGLGSTFIGAIAAPSVLARTDADVPSFSAIVQSIGYLGSFLGPVLGGAMLDVSHNVAAAFWPAIAAFIVMAVLGLRLTRLRPRETT